MANFKPGDVVMLKSGGPYMTVSSVSSGVGITSVSPGDLYCCWFDGSTVQRAVFSPSSVKIMGEPVSTSIYSQNE